MSDGKKPEPSPLNLAQILCEELNQIVPSRPEDNRGTKKANFVKLHSEDLQEVFQQLYKHKLAALCISGGGIRSATFGLGVVQALADRKLLDGFDYMSTVSGGGYLGSWLSAWIFRERLRKGLHDANPGVDFTAVSDKLRGINLAEDSTEHAGLEDFDVDKVDANAGIKEVQQRLNCVPPNEPGDPNPEPTQLQHLREYSNYMSPRVGLLSADTWTLIGIYVRNLFLNLTIFIPFMMAVLLAPRFFYSIIGSDRVHGTTAIVIVVLALFLGGFALSSVLSKLPSKNPGKDVARNTDVWNFLFAVFPLGLMAFAMSALYIGTVRTNGWPSPPNPTDDNPVPDFFGLLDNLVGFVVSALLVCAIGYALFAIRRKVQGLNLDPRTLLATILSAALWGILLWFLAPRIFDAATLRSAFTDGADSLPFLFFVCFSVPVFLLIFLAAATMFIGLSSGKVTDEDREWLARYGAWLLIVCVVWIVLNSLVLFGPLGIEKLVGFAWSGDTWEWLSSAAVAAVGLISAAVSLIGGFTSKSEVVTVQAQPKGRSFLSVAPQIAAVIFLGFIFVGLAYATTQIFEVPAFYSKEQSWLFFNVQAQNHLAILAESQLLFLLLWLVGLAGFGLFMAFFVNVNKFSLHGAYRDRLVRAYLGASNKYRKTNTFTGFDDGDNFQLHRLKKQRPLHIINATLNLVGGTNLAWQNRKAASFTMSALHSGSWCLNYRRTNEYCRNKNLGDCDNLTRCNRQDKDCKTDESGKPVCELPGKSLRLGTAMAISGAAANPNMGYYSSSVVTFLMSLFNIRLGWWLGNTGDVGSKRDWFGFGSNHFFEKSSPSVAVLPLLNETLGRTDKNKKFLNVTDGGHFENLALYEMVLRRCKLIVLSDGAADADFRFGEIANAIQKCKVDLGVDIQLVGSMNIRNRPTQQEMEKEKRKPHWKVSRSRFAIARITYPETHEVMEKLENDQEIKTQKNNIGWLLYTRPTYYAQKEPRDIMNYADSNLNFPHQSTGDQMYDEKQFEAYRGLGYFTLSEVRNIFYATSIGDPENQVDDELELLFDEQNDMRETLFGFFDLPDPGSFKPRAAKRKETE